MSPDIVIVRDGDGYRLLHGHLRLASVLRTCDEIAVDVRGEGKVNVIRTSSGYAVGKESQRLPLYRN